LKAAGNVRMRIAVIASGLAAATSLAYTAPGMPWARADVLAAPAQTIAPAAGANPAAGVAGLNHMNMYGMGGMSGMAGMDMGQAEQDTFSGVVRTAGNTVLVDATPAAVGVNTVAITVLDAQRSPATVSQWSATASLPGSGLVPVTVPLQVIAGSVAAADVSLPAAGQWTFTITVRVAGAAPVSFTQVVPIRP